MNHKLDESNAYNRLLLGGTSSQAFCATSEDVPLSEVFQQVCFIASRYRYLIGIVSFAFIFGTALYAYLATPLYTSKGIIKIEQFVPLLKDENNNSIDMQPPFSPQEQLNTNLNLISSYPVIDHALSQNNLSQDLSAYLKKNQGLFSGIISSNDDQRSLIKQHKIQANSDGNPYHHDLHVLKAYQNLLDAEAIKKTNLLSLSVTTPDPLLSAKIANTHLEAFISMVREQRQKQVTLALDFLNREAEQLAGKVAEAERRMASYAEQNGIVTVQKDESMVSRKLGVLNQLIIEYT